MNKSEIISILSDGIGLTKVETTAVVDGLIATIRYALKSEQQFEIRGLGTFKVVTRKARKFKNPYTGEVRELPERKSLVFRVANDLKRYINESENDA